jgi:catechol 2,3-dioxygenase-like lactoylglutathione lyase family enzyme
MKPTVKSLDHLVLTVSDIETTTAFYDGILGMTTQAFIAADGSKRWAWGFGDQEINLHQVGAEFDPKAGHATAGSADLCFLTDTPLEAWLSHLNQARVAVVDGPVERSGATGPIQSIYIRDPDDNLIEISTSL